MGIYALGKPCGTNYRTVDYGSGPKPVAPAPNPDPSRFRILGTQQFENACVVIAKYLDCTNYEGKKVMVFEGHFTCPIELDPHFSEDDNSPIARFKPDEKGLKLAADLAKSL